MRGLLLISSKEFDPYALASDLSSLGPISHATEERIAIDTKFGGLYIFWDLDLETSHEPEHLAVIRARVPDPSFILLSFNKPSVGDAAILGLGSVQVDLIDNEHGALLTLEEARRRIRADEDWQTAES
jgi:hypothetical protein